MSYDSTRKSFLAKLAGAAVVLGLAPRWLASGPSDRVAPAAAAPARPALAVNPDPRAIARRADSV